MKLYTFFRSSASYRVRIALNLKGSRYEQVPIHLRRGGGEQLLPAYKAINPQGLIPALEDGGKVIWDSAACLIYVARKHGGEQWLPTDADRAFVASLMGRVVEPGKFANWIAPPPVGINKQPLDFEYVRFS